MRGLQPRPPSPRRRAHPPPFRTPRTPAPFARADNSRGNTWPRGAACNPRRVRSLFPSALAHAAGQYTTRLSPSNSIALPRAHVANPPRRPYRGESLAGLVFQNGARAIVTDIEMRPLFTAVSFRTVGTSSPSRRRRRFSQVLLPVGLLSCQCSVARAACVANDAIHILTMPDSH